MSYIERIHDISTGEIIERPFTPQEIDEAEKSAELSANRLAEIESKEIARKALFDKLGITSDEAALIGL
jgi:hypothetical protein